MAKPATYIMYIILELKIKQNSPSTIKTAENMKRLPPAIVISDFVVKAYKVNDIVIANVNTAAIRTNYPPFSGYITYAIEQL